MYLSIYGIRGISLSDTILNVRSGLGFTSNHYNQYTLNVWKEEGDKDILRSSDMVFLLETWILETYFCAVPTVKLLACFLKHAT